MLFIPLIGVLVYLIARGDKMQQDFRNYVQQTAGSPTPADQLTKLADLRHCGVISAEEFDREKAKILA